MCREISEYKENLEQITVSLGLSSETSSRSSQASEGTVDARVCIIQPSESYVSVVLETVPLCARVLKNCSVVFVRVTRVCGGQYGTEG